MGDNAAGEDENVDTGEDDANDSGSDSQLSASNEGE